MNVFRLIQTPGLKDLDKLINVDFFSLGREFNVVFCIEVGMSLHVNSSNPSHIVEDFMGSHGLMLQRSFPL